MNKTITLKDIIEKTGDCNRSSLRKLNYNDVLDWIIPLHRHCDMGKIFKAFGYKPGECKIVEQGFIDNHGNFYNRKSALKHVNEFGQQCLLGNFNTDELFSEDLY